MNAMSAVAPPAVVRIINADDLSLRPTHIHRNQYLVVGRQVRYATAPMANLERLGVDLRAAPDSQLGRAHLLVWYDGVVWRIGNGGANPLLIQPWGAAPRWFQAGSVGDQISDDRLTIWLPNGSQPYRAAFQIPSRPSSPAAPLTPRYLPARLTSQQLVAMVARFGPYFAWPATQQPRMLSAELPADLESRVKQNLRTLIAKLAQERRGWDPPPPKRTSGTHGSHSTEHLLRFLLQTGSIHFDQIFEVVRQQQWPWLRPEGSADPGSGRDTRTIQFIPPSVDISRRRP
jgi:hypothetical protein